MPLPYNNNIIAAAKKLRNNPTEEENKLWYQYLSGYPVRFLRQRVIESFILDFYCAKCKLGIELDGSQHYTEQGLGHDEARTKFLNAYGITIIRFTNEQITNDFGEVCRQIDAKVKELIKTHQPVDSLPTRP
jgi:very-short-patch-repair endonuclease